MILLKKRFKGSGNLQLGEAKILKTALAVIHETHIVAHELNYLAATKYDSTNKLHEKKLLELWLNYMPKETLTHRYSDQWRKLGFQGKDPATDFRGMGCLALEDLLFLITVHPYLAQEILKASHDPISWFSFALVSIHVTQFALQCLRTRQLQYYLYVHEPKASTYHAFHAYVLYTFYKYWTSYSGHPPFTIMDFERVFSQVKVQIQKELSIRKKGMLVEYPENKKNA
ncbi:hypothetical protein HMI55_005981 [Coelomomyces lativittatus]|nr:hypothetical protein HMI56_000297 [Coelomomyces lativittatus]KAJ1513008.1 hypothetical protein HMI55_005981 [Coelomomyces lativittatus]